MTIEDIRNILNNELLIKQLKLNCKKPTYIKFNKPILKQILKNSNGLILTTHEFIFLLRNIDNLENLHIFCPICGKKNKFQGNLLRYNFHCSVKCSVCDPKTLDSRYATNLIKHGHPQWANWEQTHKTIKEKYHVDNISQVPELNKNKSENIRKKYPQTIKGRRQTIFERYGKYHYSQTQEYKDKMALQKDEIQLKSYRTKKKNKSFGNKSKKELECYNKLLTKFPDAIHHYYDENRYPYECDMYIPSLDLFIECHFYWKHGDYKNGCHAPFDKNNLQHLEMLQKWKNKNTKGYNHAIYIWTINDPEKLNCMKKNELNYKIFYTSEQFYDWFKTI